MTNVCITVDTEGDSANNPRSTFWGIEIVLPELLKLFCKYDIKATFFIQEDRICQVGTIYSGLWKSLENQRHEIAYHAHGIVGSSMEEKAGIISHGVQILRKLGFDPVSFRGGRYHFNSSLTEILERNNIKYDSSVVPGLRECFSDGTVRCNHIGAPHRPYFLSYENHCREGESRILELPINRYPELPPTIGGKLTGKKDNEEVLFDYFYKIRKDKLIIVNVHTWDGLRRLIRRSVRSERYRVIERLAFKSLGRILRCDALINSVYLGRFESFLSYISRYNDVRFTTIEEAASEIIIEQARDTYVLWR
jgi:peptidoglycan/xylan/chitin deacetylase (PgdA/CDA1 family)